VVDRRSSENGSPDDYYVHFVALDRRLDKWVPEGDLTSRGPTLPPAVRVSPVLRLPPQHQHHHHRHHHHHHHPSPSSS
jgi:hypothetical protein